MVNILNEVVNFINSMGIYGIIFSCIIIFFESIIPIIPLLVFVTINYIVLGPILGFIISWIFTVLGCIFSYYLFYKGFSKKLSKLSENKELLKKYTNMFKNISTGKLLIIIAMPFTPAFMVNIVAGITHMDFKKYFIALLFGKISLVIYSAYIGTSFIESLKNPIVLIKMFFVISIVYIFYYMVKKLFKIEV